MIDVTEATFGPDVVEKSMQVLVVVDLWAEWCEPCKQLSPVLERVVAGFDGTVVLAKVDVDANPRISQAFGVQSIPTVVAIAGGQPVDAFSGALPEPEVRAWIQRLVDALKSQLPGMSAAPAGEAPPVDPRIEQAEQAMEEGDFDAAIAAYERYSADHPGDNEVSWPSRSCASSSARSSCRRTPWSVRPPTPATCRPSWTPPPCCSPAAGRMRPTRR